MSEQYEPPKKGDPFIKDPLTGGFAPIKEWEAGILLSTGSKLVYEFDGEKMVQVGIQTKED